MVAFEKSTLVSVDSNASTSSSSSPTSSVHVVTGVPVGPAPHVQFAAYLLRYEELNATIASLQAQNVSTMQG